MSGYAVDPADLQACDVAVGDVAAGARLVLAEVRASARALLDAGWRGGAAAGFRLGWEQWVDGASAMLDALDSMAAALGGSAAGYATTDEAVRVSLARMRT